jgi:hypothetical protein
MSRRGCGVARAMLSAFLLAVWLPGCASYQQTSQPLAELTAPPRPVNQARVTLEDGRRIQVTTPRVDGDTLRGTEGLSRTSGPPVAIPLASITQVEIFPPSNAGYGTRVVAVVAAAGLAALLVWGLSSMSDWGWMGE